jgi:hypothetical protein
MIKGFMHINMLGDCLSNIFAIPNIKRGLFWVYHFEFILSLRRVHH